MKGFTVAEARARFGDLLDEAEQGDPVVILRRGVRFVLRAEATASQPAPGRFFDWLDPAVEAGDWTWALTKSGAAFRSPKRKKQR